MIAYPAKQARCTWVSFSKGGSNNFLTVRREIDGTVVISSPKVSPKALADLKEVNLKTIVQLESRLTARY